MSKYGFVNPGYDLILRDSELLSAAKELGAFGSRLEDALAQYDSTLESITETSIRSGSLHDALVLYCAYVKKLEKISAGVGRAFKRIVKNYLSEIDTADDYLYVSDLSPVRDFSDEEYQHLINCLDDPWCSLTDSVGDWLYDKVVKVADILPWDNVSSFLNSCHRLLLDYNDETADGLSRLFERVYGTDADYGRSISGSTPTDSNYYTCHFGCVAAALFDIRDMMTEMSRLLSAGTKSFNVSAVKSGLNGIYSELLNDFHMMLAVPGPDSIPSTEQISRFAELPWAATFSTDFASVGALFIADLGGLQAAEMTFFQMFGMARATAAHGDYQTYATKELLLSVMKDMCADENSDAEYWKDYTEGLKTFLKYYKKYGKKTYEYLNTHRDEDGRLLLDGRTIDAKEFCEFLDGLGNAQTILDMGGKGIDYLAALLTDYSRGLEVLDSFEKNYSGDPTILSAVSDIKALYGKEFCAWAEQAVEGVTEASLGLALDALSKVSPVMLTLSAIDKGITLAGDVSGLGEQARSTYDAMTHFQIQSASNEAYLAALKKFQAAAPDSREYGQLAADVSNCFDLNKQNMIKMFDSMANASDGMKKSYFRYCAGKAESLSMTSDTPPRILSYEEYLKVYAVAE